MSFRPSTFLSSRRVPPALTSISIQLTGKVVINSLLTPERYSHDFRRPLRSLALEPNFAKRSSKAFVAGGMAGTLSLMEKGWLGGFGGLGTAMGIGGGGSGQHKETVLHEGEGPIWGAVWEKGGLIAWANDLVSFGSS